MEQILILPSQAPTGCGVLISEYGFLWAFCGDCNLYINNRDPDNRWCCDCGKVYSGASTKIRACIDLKDLSVDVMTRVVEIYVGAWCGISDVKATAVIT